MPPPLNARFINQIDYLARQLLSALAKHPYAVQPESNVLLHQFEGLALHTNHFAEKNGLEVEFSQQFRDMANSIKHARTDQQKQVELFSTVMFEASGEGFRFIRNTILAEYPDRRSFDAIEELRTAIELYLPIVGFQGPNLTIPENNTYPFYEWAFGYHRDDLSVYMDKLGLMTLQKRDDHWIPVDVRNIRSVVLDKALIGQDPRPSFPKV